MKLTTTFALQTHYIIRQLALIIISILMVKSGLSQTDIGNFETLLFLSTTVSFFWINGFLQYFLSEYSSLNENQKKDFLFHKFLIFNILSIIIFVAITLFKPFFLWITTGVNELLHISIFSLYLLFLFPAFLLEPLFTSQQRPLSILIYTFISNILLIPAIMLPIWLRGNIQYSIWGMIGIAIIRYLWILYLILKNKYFHFDSKTIFAHLKKAMPLAGYFLLGGFIATFSSWIVNWYYIGDKSVFAVFRYGARELPITLALTTGLSNAIVPILAANTEGGVLKNIELLKHKVLKTWHILFPISMLLMLSSKALFKFFYNEDFIESAAIFNIYLLLITSRALFPQSILLALKETKMMFRISLLETIFIVVSSFIFIHFWGLKGVAWAVVIGFLLEKILMIFYLKKRYGIDFQNFTNIKLYFLYAFLIISCYIISIFV